MTLSPFYRRALLFVALLFPMLFPELASAAAGHFLFVHGRVSVTTGSGATHQATKGLPVEEGETIISGLHGAAQLRMEDGAFLSIRPNTKLHIDTYAYKEKGRKETSTISLLKGTFRAITGKIGKAHPQRDLVKTPVATIGIRGTDHEPAYIPTGQPGAGAYDKVNKGKTYIKTDAGSLNLGPNQIGHASASNKPPVALPSMPAFYKTPNRAAVKEHKKKNEKSGDNSKNGSKNKSNSSDKSKGSSNKKDHGKNSGDKGSNDKSQDGGKSDSSSSSGSSDKGNSNSSGDNGQGSSNQEGSSSNSGNSSSGTSNNSSGSSKTTDSGSNDSGSSSSGGTLVASSSHSNTTTSDATTSNADTPGTSTSATITTGTTATTSTSSTSSPIVQTYSATGSDSSKVNLTTQTTTTASGTTTSLSSATASAQTTANVWQTSYVANYSSYFSPWTDNASTWWQGTLTRDANGNVTGWSAAYSWTNGTAPITTTQTATVTGMSGTPQQWQANSYATTGITYGSYNATAVNYQYSDLNLTTNTTTTSNYSDSLLLQNSQPSAYNWIVGSGIYDYMPMAYTGTANFAYDGGHAVDAAGNIATLSGNASFNFANMSMNLGLTAKTANATWNASIKNTPIDWGTFYSDTYYGYGGSLVATYTPTGGSTANYTVDGQISGSLSGKGLAGIASSFAFSAYNTTSGTSADALSGVAAFSNSGGTISTAVNHQWIATSGAIIPLGSKTYNAGNLANAWIDAFANNTNSITKSASGGITDFTLMLPQFGTTTTTVNGVTSTSYMFRNAATQMHYTGTVQDFGIDPTTGISWGRWAGNMSATPLISTTYTTSLPAFLNYIAGPATNQPVLLPTSGTYNFALVGNTSPIDAAGTVGKLNSASLAADFTNMTVNVGIKATVGNTTLQATGNGIPISGTLFHTGGNGGTPLTVTCNGTCYSNNQGDIGGTFTSNQSNGAANGAAVTYSLGTNNPNATTTAAQQGITISGVAAFKK